jgi:hypothetical protein
MPYRLKRPVRKRTLLAGTIAGRSCFTAQKILSNSRRSGVSFEKCTGRWDAFTCSVTNRNVEYIKRPNAETIGPGMIPSKVSQSDATAAPDFGRFDGE